MWFPFKKKAPETQIQPLGTFTFAYPHYVSKTTTSAYIDDDVVTSIIENIHAWMHTANILKTVDNKTVPNIDKTPVGRQNELVYKTNFLTLNDLETLTGFVSVLTQDDMYGYGTRIQNFAISLYVDFGPDRIDALITRIYNGFDALTVKDDTDTLSWQVVHSAVAYLWLVYLIHRALHKTITV